MVKSHCLVPPPARAMDKIADTQPYTPTFLKPLWAEAHALVSTFTGIAKSSIGIKKPFKKLPSRRKARLLSAPSRRFGAANTGMHTCSAIPCTICDVDQMANLQRSAWWVTVMPESEPEPEPEPESEGVNYLTVPEHFVDEESAAYRKLGKPGLDNRWIRPSKMVASYKETERIVF
tara:strand:+ start:328 stop:855 length:528 start_codon:yes stop_codon:yes gene_type:complete